MAKQDVGSGGGGGGTGMPAAPSNLVAHAVSTSEIDLTWTDNSGNESAFLIERRAMTGGTWAQVATVPAGTTSLRNGGLASGTWYLYRVRAGNSSGNSPYSNEAKAKTRMGKK